MATPIWGSFERNTGTWTPYSAVENELIEASYQNRAPSAEVPTCFNAVVHFNYGGGAQDFHHQMTPAVGSKPPGFRSVLRGTVGQKVTLYWWDEARMWRLDYPPTAPQYVQEVGIQPPPNSADVGGPEYHWQWCDLTGSAIKDAVEVNWHPYASEHSEEIEQAWTRGERLQLTIGLTGYSIGDWQGSYGTQRNLTTNCVRQVRRGRFTVMDSTPGSLVDDSCALCTELFTDTPQWPIRRTPCGHAFHYTCLQHILRRPGRENRCPMCRRSLRDMVSGSTGGSGSGQGGDYHHPSSSLPDVIPQEPRYFTGAGWPR